MDKGDIRIPKYVVKALAEKLQAFIEDQEKSFKFHPWQVTSTLNKMQKSIHSGLPERAIHHLHDTGTAHEILKFSNQKEKSVKIAKVKEYLYSYLGLNSLAPKSEENGCYIVYQESQMFDTLRRNRIFEIRRLVDAIIQQLEQTSKMNKSRYCMHPYNWNTLISHPLKIPKQQTLAHCTYSSCLFHKHGERMEKKKKRIKKQLKSPKPNFIKRNIKTATPKVPHIRSVQQNILPEIHVSHQNGPKFMKPKKMVETTTQTNSWSLKTPQRESIFEGEPIDISDIEQSEESESDFYCKSDTLNDASMITEEVASDFAEHVVPAEVRPKNPVGKRRSSSSSGRDAKKDRPVCLEELKMDESYQENYSSHELIKEKEKISNLKNLRPKIKAINNFNSKPYERDPTVNMSNSKRSSKETLENHVSYSKSSALNLEKNGSTKSRDVSVEEFEKSVSRSMHSEAEIIKNSMNSKSDEDKAREKNTSFLTNSVKVEESNHSSIHLKSEENKISEKDEKDFQPEKVPLPVSINLLEEPTDHEVKEKCNEMKEPSLLVEVIPSHIRRASLSRCKASMHESIAEQLENENCVLNQVNDADERVAEVSVTNADDSKIINENFEDELAKENSRESPKKGMITFSNNSEDANENKQNDGTLAKLCSTDIFKTSSGNSLDSVVMSEDETTPCPKSSSSGSAATDAESERSSMKENDNMSLEYSSHWTAEYSSTEFSESEDEEFKQKFKAYKKSLLEDDEGIAASCEDEISFATERYPKDITVASGGEKNTLKEINKRNYSIITPSFDEETSYYMDTETFEDNGISNEEQISRSIDTLENNDTAASSENISSPENSHEKQEIVDFDEGDLKTEESVRAENTEEIKNVVFHEYVKANKESESLQNGLMHDDVNFNQQDALSHEYENQMDTNDHENDDFAEKEGLTAFDHLQKNEDGATSCEEEPFNDNDEMCHDTVKPNRESFDTSNPEKNSNCSPKTEVLSNQSDIIIKDDSLLHNENTSSHVDHIENEDFVTSNDKTICKDSEISENYEELSQGEPSAKDVERANKEDSESDEDKTYLKDEKTTTGYENENSSVQITQNNKNDSKPYEDIERTDESKDLTEDDASENDNSEKSYELQEKFPLTEVEHADLELPTKIRNDCADEINNFNEDSRITESEKEENYPNSRNEGETQSPILEVNEIKEGSVDALGKESSETEKTETDEENSQLGKEEDLSHGNKENKVIEDTNEDELIMEGEVWMEKHFSSVYSKPLSDQDGDSEEQRDESWKKVSTDDGGQDRIKDSESEAEEETSSNPVTQIVARSLEMSNDISVKFDDLKEDSKPDDEDGLILAACESDKVKVSFEENALSEDFEENESEDLSTEIEQRNESKPICLEESNNLEIKDSSEITDDIKEINENDNIISIDERVLADKNYPSVSGENSMINENSYVNSQETNSQEHIISEMDVKTEEHSDDEDHGSKKLLKVLSLKDTQPFEDLDMMNDQLLEIEDDDGWNMLHLAASKGLHKDVQSFLEHGLSINSLTGSNNTPLQLAIMNNHLKCCQILLKEGANLSTDEGLFNDDFVKSIEDLSPEMQELLENYKSNYEKVQKLVEIFNEFRKEKKDVEKTFSRVILKGLADLTIDDDGSVECTEEQIDE